MENHTLKKLAEMENLESPTNILCYLVKQRIDKGVSHGLLKAEFTNAGFGGFVPKETTSSTALSIACERVKARSKRLIEIRRFPDSDTERKYGIHYWDDEVKTEEQTARQQNIIRLNKNTGAITFKNDILKTEIEAVFDESLLTVIPKVIRTTTMNILRAIGGVMWGFGEGSAGGAYLLPACSITQLNRLKTVVKNLGGRLSRLPIYDTDAEDARDIAEDIVGSHLHQLDEWLGELQKIESKIESEEGVRYKVGTLETRLEQIKALRIQSSFFKDVLGNTLSTLVTKMDQIEKLSQKLIDDKVDTTTIAHEQAVKKVEKKKPRRLLNLTGR